MEIGINNNVKAQAEPEFDPCCVKWDGKDDEENGQTGKRLFVWWIYAIMVSSCSIVITCTSSVYSMVMVEMGERFHISNTVTAIGITFFFFFAWHGLGLHIWSFHNERTHAACHDVYAYPILSCLVLVR